MHGTEISGHTFSTARPSTSRGQSLAEYSQHLEELFRDCTDPANRYTSTPRRERGESDWMMGRRQEGIEEAVNGWRASSTAALSSHKESLSALLILLNLEVLYVRHIITF